MEPEPPPLEQDGKFLREVNALILSHLRDTNLRHSATPTPLSVETPVNKLLQLVAKGLAAEKDEAAARELSSPPAMLDSGAGAAPVHVGTSPIDSSVVEDGKGSSKNLPRHETKHVSEHKEMSTPMSSGKCKEKIDPVRAVWVDKMKKLFIDICIEQVMASGRPGVNFSSSTWRTIISKFGEGTGHHYNQKQLKNQLDLMKRQYGAWVTLCSQSGIRHHEATHAVKMEPERWDEYLKSNPAGKMFQHKPLQFADEMEVLFKDTCATGTKKRGSSTGSLPEDITHGEQIEDAISLEDTQSVYVPTQIQPEAVEEVESDEFIRTVRQKCPHPCKRTRDAKGIDLDSRIDDLISLIDGEKSKETPDVPSISECIASLRTIKEVPARSALFMCALRSFREKENREIWMALPEEEARIAWLDDLHKRDG